MSQYTTNRDLDVHLPLRAFHNRNESQASPGLGDFPTPHQERYYEESEASAYFATTPEPWTTSRNQTPNYNEQDRPHLAEPASWRDTESNDSREHNLEPVPLCLQLPHISAMASPLYDAPPRPSLDNNFDDNGDKAPANRPIGSDIRWWYLDIIAVVTSVASLCAIIGVLAVYNGKSQSAWPSDVLTINGLVAILATICRGSLMASVASVLSQEKWNRFAGSKNALSEFSLFDEASKGSWGSLKVLSRFKLAHPGCLGAALTILTLAFSTFSQQLVTFETNNVLDEVPTQMASVPRSIYVNTVNGFANSFNPSHSTKLAIYNGFMSSTIAHPQASCPTGNCTWPTIPSMGVCGSCVDLTSEIKVIQPSSSFCAVTVGSLNLTGSCGPGPLDFTTVFKVGPGSRRAFEGVGDIRWDSPNLIGSFSALGLPGTKALSSGLGSAVATECALWYCLQAHEVRVQLGETQDRVIQTWNRATSLAPGSTNGNITFTLIPAEMNVDSTDMYGMPNMQVLGMSQYVNKTFVGNVSADGGLGVIAPSTDFAEGMQRGLDDSDSWIDRLARSMTNEIRSNQSAVGTSTQYDGTTYTTVVIIVVRWPWIAYPASLVLLSLVYLAYIIIYTAQLKVKPWKSDALLPLCLQLDSDLKVIAMEGVGEPDGIGERIGRYRVKLQTSGNRPVGLTREGG